MSPLSGGLLSQPRSIMAKPQPYTAKVNFWAFLRDVTMHAITKGQFPAVAMTGLLAVIIVKLPANHVALLVDRILANLTTLKGLSLIMNIVFPILWAVHTRWQRGSIAAEMDRIGREKTALQEELTGLRSSSPKKKGT